MDAALLEPGQPVALCSQNDEVHLLRVPEKDGVIKVQGLGVLSHDLFAQARLGELVPLGRSQVRLLPPTPDLVFRALSRRAQVIGPQDGARMAYEAGIGPGTTVVEGGLGSGALTSYLAFLVGDQGRVHGFEVRKDHLEVATGNLERAGLLDRVEVHHGSLEEAEVPCQAFLVDVPDPETVVPAAARCLVPGGRAVFYTPIVDQMQAVHEALGEAPFSRVRSLEQLERGWTVHGRGARPDFDMLGHTGFLTVATRVQG